jgi:hypothetical protein
MNITTAFGCKLFYNFDDVLRCGITKLEIRYFPSIVYIVFRILATGGTEFAIFSPTFAKLLASLPNINISDVGFFKGNLRSQTFFEVPPDCYCT